MYITHELHIDIKHIYKLTSIMAQLTVFLNAFFITVLDDLFVFSNCYIVYIDVNDKMNK